MNNREKNHLESYRATSQFFTDNGGAFTSVPAIGVQAGKLKDSITLIDSLSALTGADTRGVTEAKKELLRQMIESSFAVAGAVGAYASENNDLALKARVKVNDSKYQKASQDEKDDIAQVIHDAANDTLASLADYGVTAATLTALQTRIDAYRLSITSPRDAIKGRKTNNELIREELDRAGMICDERLDGLMLQFEETQPALYGQYTGTRDLIERGHRSSGEDQTQGGTGSTNATNPGNNPTPPPAK